MTNYPSQHVDNHWITFIDIPKYLDDENDVPVPLVNVNGQVLKISQKFFSYVPQSNRCKIYQYTQRVATRQITRELLC